MRRARVHKRNGGDLAVDIGIFDRGSLVFKPGETSLLGRCSFGIGHQVQLLENCLKAALTVLAVLCSAQRDWLNRCILYVRIPLRICIFFHIFLLSND